MKKLGALAASAAVVALLSAWTPTAAAQYGYPSAYDPLTGTYELDRPRGDDPQRIVDQAIRQLPAAERWAASARLVERLQLRKSWRSSAEAIGSASRLRAYPR